MTVTDGQKTVNLRVSGRVQGVGYRAWAMARAGRLGLRGWVRNRRDGTVELLVAGPAAAIEQMIADCHAGPSLSRVTEVTATAAEPPDGNGFQQLPTV